VGVVVPRVLNPDLSLQPTVAPIQSPAVALVRASGLSRLVPNRWQPRWSTHWDHARAREIQAAIAPVVLVRREAWDDLGGFTEEAFMYAEDLDLCWRARRRGWRVWFAADAVFVHVGNVSGRAQWQSEARRSERVGQAEAAMMRRHLSRPSAALALALLAGGLLARALVFRLAGDRERAAVLRAAARGYLGR
jgi:GT2 family glycosyltransferase